MFKDLKTVYQKVHSFLFGQEDEHLHTKEERKKYYGRIKTDNETEARIIHQYPKQGKFRFPLITDETKNTTSIKRKEPIENKPTPSPKRQDEFKNEQKNNKIAQNEKSTKKPEKVVTLKKEERKKFQGVNFRAANIPSPIYAFGNPPSKNKDDYAEFFKYETEELLEAQKQTNKHQIKAINIDPSTPQLLEDESRVQQESKFTQKEEGAFSNAADSSPVETIKETNILEKELVEETPMPIHNDQIINTKETNDDHRFDVEPSKDDQGIEPFSQKEVAATLFKEVMEDKGPLIKVDDVNDPTVSPTETVLEEENILSDKSEMDNQEGSLEVADSIPKPKQLEQFPETVNKLEDDTKEIEFSKERRTVVPFNVLMLHKDRTVMKKYKDQQTKKYQFPTLQLLNIPEKKVENSNHWLEEKKQLLENTLANFNVQAKVVGVTKGPSVTRFEIQPQAGVKVSKVTSLTDDIKLSLSAKDIRIEAPIPGRNAIGIEVPNNISDPVFIREILRSGEFQNNPSPLTVAMGLDIAGKPVVTDIQKMPHGLIAGATGSGKSVCINSILISIMFKATPDEVKLMLVDPKMVELAPYNDIPHLVTPVITDAKQATIALKWAVEEMERRYELFVQNGVRDIKRYNEVMKKEEDESPAMPYIVIIIDELADLMMVSPQDVEEAICRIAQKARACGIHLLVATQRPSVDVITGLIKANIPTRIAFSVSSQADSRTIIDSGGAERLLGKGDMLLFENGASKPVRVQGNFVSDEEIDRVIDLVKKERKPNYLFDKAQLIKTFEAADQEDDLFEEACYYVLEQGGASSSSLQRRFRIGFNRAARLIEMMEARGIISEAMGSKPRNVLISEEELSDRL